MPHRHVRRAALATLGVVVVVLVSLANAWPSMSEPVAGGAMVQDPGLSLPRTAATTAAMGGAVSSRVVSREAKIETLRAGDIIMTPAGGTIAVTWVGDGPQRRIDVIVTAPDGESMGAVYAEGRPAFAILGQPSNTIAHGRVTIESFSDRDGTVESFVHEGHHLRQQMDAGWRYLFRYLLGGARGMEEEAYRTGSLGGIYAYVVVRRT